MFLAYMHVLNKELKEEEINKIDIDIAIFSQKIISVFRKNKIPLKIYKIRLIILPLISEIGKIL